MGEENKSNDNLLNEDNLEENKSNSEYNKSNNNLSNEDNLEENKSNDNLLSEDNSKKKIKYPEVYFTDKNNNSIKALIKHPNKIKANVDGNEVVGHIIGNTKDRKKLFLKYDDQISE